MIYRVEISKEQVAKQEGRAVNGPQIFYVQAQIYGQTGQVDLFSVVDKAGNSVASDVYGTWIEDEIKAQVFNQHIESYNQ